jgi:hypothetical protein
MSKLFAGTIFTMVAALAVISWPAMFMTRSPQPSCADAGARSRTVFRQSPGGRRNRRLWRPARSDCAQSGRARLSEGRGEAQRFLGFPTVHHAIMPPVSRKDRGGPEVARRLLAMGRPVRGTQAEAYLRARRIIGRLDWPSLRSHPTLWYRADEDAPRQSWRGLLAAITDPHGLITGVHRIWLDRCKPGKAPLPDPKRTPG